MASSTVGWAVGPYLASGHPTFQRWNDDLWSEASLPTDERLWVVAALSSDEAWVATHGGSILRRQAVYRTYLPLLRRDPRPPCDEILSKEKIWRGDLDQTCDIVVKKHGDSSLRLIANDFSIVEVYSPLIPVEPGGSYRVSYWVRTDLELDPVEPAQMYGKVIAAQYTAQAQEGDGIGDNRLDPGFGLGESVGGETDWVFKEYTFETLGDAAFVRLRGIIGGPVGTARGSMWLDQVTITEE
jgi:hypothetical protein